MKQMLPKIFFCRDAWLKAWREAQKFFDLGLKKEGKPHEAAMYPLCHLILRPGIEKSPLELVELEEIEALVVTHVFYPEDKYKDYSAHRAAFLPAGNASFNRLLNRFIERYPLLDVLGKCHSHPFKADNLSGGDLEHSIFNSFFWFRSKGLNTMFSLLLSKRKKLGWEDNWKLNCFGLADGENLRLPAVVIDRSHSLIARAKAKPYFFSREGIFWHQEHRKTMKQGGFEFSEGDLRRGWRRWMIKMKNCSAVICLPPFFPQQKVRVFRLNEAGKISEPLAIPANSTWSSIGDDLDNYIIPELLESLKNNF